MTSPDTARSIIESLGGLHTRAGLAQRWGVSRQYVQHVVRRPDFPPGIDVGGDSTVWFGHQADAWRAGHRTRGGQ